MCASTGPCVTCYWMQWTLKRQEGGNERHRERNTHSICIEISRWRSSNRCGYSCRYSYIFSSRCGFRSCFRCHRLERTMIRRNERKLKILTDMKLPQLQWTTQVEERVFLHVLLRLSCDLSGVAEMIERKKKQCEMALDSTLLKNPDEPARQSRNTLCAAGHKADHSSKKTLCSAR